MKKRTKRVEVQFTEAEYEQLLQRKTKARLAEWVRETCLGSELNKKAKPAPKVDPTLLVALSKQDRQERVARYYRAAQEEHERCRAEARSRIEANQRAIEQVRERKSGIKELTQKLFERVRMIVSKKLQRYEIRSVLNL